MHCIPPIPTKSFYTSHVARYLYETESQIWASFWLVGLSRIREFLVLYMIILSSIQVRLLKEGKTDIVNNKWSVSVEMRLEQAN